MSDSAPNAPTTATPKLIWGLHTRLFHWLLVLLVTGLLISGLGENMDWMTWHIYMGYGVLGLIVFRLVLGLLGRDYGHFSHFVLAPSKIIAYLKGEQRFQGHNPLGTWSVIAMLLALTVQAITGLLTTDEFFVEGPWVYGASESLVSLGSKIHGINWIIIASLIGLHIAAILFYQVVKKDRLIEPMVTGKRKTSEPAAVKVTYTPLERVLFAAVLAGVLTWAFVSLPY